jgi:dihydrofolate reductase
MNLTPLSLVQIAAISDDQIISKEDHIPWHLPNDIQHFRNLTHHQTCLVGNTTYLQMKNWENPCRFFVLSNQSQANTHQATFFTSIDHAIQQATLENLSTLYIIGGSQIYHQTFNDCHTLMITRVHTILHTGLSYPIINLNHWQLIKQKHYSEDQEHKLAYTIEEYQKIDSLKN